MDHKGILSVNIPTLLLECLRVSGVQGVKTSRYEGQGGGGGGGLGNGKLRPQAVPGDALKP